MFVTAPVTELFDIFQSHAYEKLFTTRLNKKKNPTQTVAELPASDHPVVSKAHTVELIMMDVSRTFPSLCIFQEVSIIITFIDLVFVAACSPFQYENRGILIPLITKKCCRNGAT